MINLIPISRSDKLIEKPFHHKTKDLFDRFFDDFGMPSVKWDESFFNPSVDISETDTQVVVKAEVPGMKRENIDVTLSNGLLTISGEKKSEHEEKNERYHLAESKSGSFRRSFRVSDDIDPKDIDASYKDGILKVVLPKTEKSQPKKIEVKS